MSSSLTFDEFSDRVTQLIKHYEPIVVKPSAFDLSFEGMSRKTQQHIALKALYDVNWAIIVTQVLPEQERTELLLLKMEEACEQASAQHRRVTPAHTADAKDLDSFCYRHRLYLDDLLYLFKGKERSTDAFELSIGDDDF